MKNLTKTALFALGLSAMTLTGAATPASARGTNGQPCAMCCGPMPGPLGPVSKPKPKPEPVPVKTGLVEAVDLVICLDTSGSMSGLIDAARKKIWDIVSLLGTTKGKIELRVALVSFGGMQNADNGYVVLETPLTDDLDKTYETLMKLRANGGTEYVGGAIKTALDKLSWNAKPGTMKMIFVAGNESADQDPTNKVRDVVKQAAGQGVTINTIYCGNAKSSDAAGWIEVSTLGKGSFTAIDQNNEIRIPSPYDAKLNELSGKLNTTYLAYGRHGAAGAARQKKMDADANKVGVAAERANAKATGLYTNSAWDLIDAVDRKGFDWSKLKDAELPKALRGKNLAEKTAYVAKLKAERAAIQAEILKLGKQRDAFVKAELAKRANGKETLQDALTKAIRAQAEKAGLSFTK